MTKWNYNIDSAPKTGTEILVAYTYSTELNLVVSASWQTLKYEKTPFSKKGEISTWVDRNNNHINNIYAWGYLPNAPHMTHDYNY